MKNNSTKIISLCIALIMISCSEDTIDLEAALGAVKGRVVNKGTNEPLENVKIATNPATSTVFTDAEGNYKIENIPVGEYSLSAQREGLLAKFEPITVIADKEIEVVIEMSDETAGNRPPNASVLLLPVDNAVNLSEEVTLVWQGVDPDKDELTYNIQVKNNKNEMTQTFEGITDTTFVLSELSYSTKYFWQIIADDGINDPVYSDAFTFQTGAPPNNRIIYTKSIGANSVIYSADEEGKTEIQLTSESTNSFRPRRNVYTNTIAFLQSVGSQTHLFTMNEDGSEIKQVTSNVVVSGFNLEEIDFSWDVKGAKLLFANQDKLYSILVDGSGLSLLYQTTNGKLITEIDKNEEQDIIALKTNDLDGYGVEIFTINASGVVQNTILSGVLGAAGSINLSIDGSRLLYGHDTSGFENNEYRQLDTHVFIYNFSDASTIDISLQKLVGTNDLDARFSPNETGVILTNTSNDGISVKNIQTMTITNLSSRATVVKGASMGDWE